ncbi:MAG: hypothetical protein H6Q00_3536 [Holophagaceae bacterium]|nr:hypothetical protein [Holophagaceae bacterium]
MRNPGNLSPWVNYYGSLQEIPKPPSSIPLTLTGKTPDLSRMTALSVGLVSTGQRW